MDSRFADCVVRDTTYGLRLLRRSPIFTLVAMLTLALGVGANAAIFQRVDAIGLRRLGIAHPEQLAEVRPDGPQAFGSYDGINAKATYPLWEQMQTHQQAFAAMFAWGDTWFPLGRGADAHRVRGLWVSGGFFPVLGIAPERGRLLAPADDRRGCGAGSVVVSHAFWQTSLGGRDSAIGSALTVFEQPFTIIGVAPASFTGLEVGQTFDIALPLCSAALVDARLEQRDRWWLTTMGRLAPDWTIARANEHMRTLGAALLDATVPTGYDATLADGYRHQRLGVVPADRGVSRLRDSHWTSLSLLLGLTGLVLLITCGNLATLMLARASARSREAALRVAIGASRGRLVLQMLIESLLVAAGGAVLAVPVAVISAQTLVSFIDTPETPISLALTIDWRLLGFVGTIATVAAVLFGLVPALRISMADPIAVLRQASRGATIDRHRARFQKSLIVAQVAVSMVLVFSALLFVQTFRNLAAVAPGFEADHTIVIMFSDAASQNLPAAQKVAFQQQLTSTLRSVPGVVAAASSTHVPLSGESWAHFFRVSGSVATERRASRFAYVSPEYFQTLQIVRRSGRDFTDLDAAHSRRVMLVNESFVRSHLRGQEPIGAIINTLAEPGFPDSHYEIIGVVGDTKYADLRDENCWCEAGNVPTVPIAYVPIAQIQSPYAWAPVIVRVSAASEGLTSAITRQVVALNPGIKVDATPLKTLVRARLARERMVAWLAAAFGLLATALVTVGLYGLIAYLAVSRRHEIGIRLSLGSTRGQIAGLLLRSNLSLMMIGLAVGLPLAVVAMRAAGTLLFGLSPSNPPAMIGAVCVLSVAGLLAAALPAWRAARTRPEIALRCD